MTIFQDNLFVQMTPGEVSQDQAVRNFFYYDPDEFVNHGLAANYWSPAGESLEVGSLITMRGILGKQTAVPLPHPHTLTQVVFQVWKKEKNPPGHRDKYRIYVNIGPDTSYINTNPLTNPLVATDLNMEHTICKYRGFVMYQPFALGPTPNKWLINIGASRFHLSKGDFCWGQLVTPPYSTAYSQTHFVAGVIPLPTYPGPVEHPESIEIVWSGTTGPDAAETHPGSGVFFPFWVRVEAHQILVNV